MGFGSEVWLIPFGWAYVIQISFIVMHFQDIYCIPKCEKLKSLLKTFTPQNQILSLEEQLYTVCCYICQKWIFIFHYRPGPNLQLLTWSAKTRVADWD